MQVVGLIALVAPLALVGLVWLVLHLRLRRETKLASPATSTDEISPL